MKKEKKRPPDWFDVLMVFLVATIIVVVLQAFYSGNGIPDDVVNASVLLVSTGSLFMSYAVYRRSSQ